MLFLVAARRTLRSAIPQTLAANQSLKLLLPRCRGYASIPKPTNPMMVNYLVATYGFSADKAALVSKRVAHFNSPDKPEAVRSFLNKEGFSDAQVKAIITLQPHLLYASPENTIHPNLSAIRDIGLSSATLRQLILSSPALLHSSLSVSRIKFWRDFFGGDDESLLKAFKCDAGLCTHDISRSIAPKMSLLQSHGVSSIDIQRFVLNYPRKITCMISLLEDSLNRAKKFGFKPESKMFVIGLHIMMSNSREGLQKKIELFKRFGWSEDDFLCVLRRAPGVLGLSEKNLQATMDFLVGEVRLEPTYMTANPRLLTLSLEKRLRPRYCVFRLLDSKGLSDGMSFSSACGPTNEDFVKRYIMPHKDKISGLHETYIAACG